MAFNFNFRRYTVEATVWPPPTSPLHLMQHPLRGRLEDWTR
jgi:hypothetical protein